MTTPVEKRDNSKFYEFHEEVGHNINECMHLKIQIEELLKARKLSHLIKELKQNNVKDQSKVAKKGETSNKDKALSILMVHPWHKVARKKITRSFSPVSEISFPPLGEEKGRPRVHKIKAVPSTTHGMLKFPMEGGVLTLRSSRIISLEYVMVSEPKAQLATIEHLEKERIKISIHLEYLEKIVAIGSTLTEEGRGKLCDLLKRNLDVFAWKPADMTGVPRHIAEHHLNVREECYPIGSGILLRIPFQVLPGRIQQIKMAKEDEEKTAFITNQGIFCYSKMLFGLKNAGATYQRLVDKAFYKQIGRNLEVYVDDLVIKSRMEDEIIRDMEETFRTLREINMKLNPKKYTFGVEEGMFLDVQKLNGKLARLNRFLGKSAEKSLPFFKTLKKCTKKSDFYWTTKAEKAFKQMKKIIADLPMLIAPREKEELIIYLVASREAVNAILITEGRKADVNLFQTKKKFPSAYNHSDHQSTNQAVLIKAVGGRKVAKWSIELGEYDIQYRPRVSIKGQILADFIVERPKDDSADDPTEIEEELPEPWILFTDGSSCIDGSAAGLILTNPEGMEITYALRFRFKATNNEAEYEALIAGLRKANVDSRLVANQVNGSYIVKEAGMIQYLEKVMTLTQNFRMFLIKQVPRSRDKKADALSKIACTSFIHLSKQVLVEEHKEKSINEIEVMAVVEEEGDTWMTLIFEYLTEDILPAEANQAIAIWRKSK
ncbi:reverse transcriptase domain-containing protein [Tanacetum coccineum]|uniref:Reverse transcriptase domain-containing protein n=1 Tax=Tanacetum coccineum TaxID=301880 RepID=A0ABQ4YIA6_9ASTR